MPLDKPWQRVVACQFCRHATEEVRPRPTCPSGMRRAAPAKPLRMPSAPPSTALRQDQIANLHTSSSLLDDQGGPPYIGVISCPGPRAWHFGDDRERHCAGWPLSTGYSSVGRASDCRDMQQSDGPCFDSGWPEMTFLLAHRASRSHTRACILMLVGRLCALAPICGCSASRPLGRRPAWPSAPCALPT